MPQTIEEVLGLCGCGDADEVYAACQDMLRARKDNVSVWSHERFQNWPEEAVWLLLNHLDQAGLIEHGTIIDSSWLTREGEHLLQRLEA